MKRCMEYPTKKDNPSIGYTIVNKRVMTKQKVRLWIKSLCFTNICRGLANLFLPIFEYLTSMSGRILDAKTKITKITLLYVEEIF
jgi:hypothetical protein